MSLLSTNNEYQPDIQPNENGYKILHLFSKQILCPLSGPISEWKKGKEVYVKNIPPHLTIKELYTWFHRYGKIMQIKLHVNKKGQSKRCAYILYERLSEAKNAVNCGNGLCLKYLCGSWKLRVEISCDNRNIYINNYPKNWTRDRLEDVVKETCPGYKRIVLFKNTYCFLEFKSHSMAFGAIIKLKQHLQVTLRHESVNVNWAYTEPTPALDIMKKVKTLFIRGITMETNTADVEAEVERIVGSELMPVHIRKDKHFAFLIFENRAKAEQAKQLLKGGSILGEQIYVAWARPYTPRPSEQPNRAILTTMQQSPSHSLAGAPACLSHETPISRGRQTSLNYQYRPQSDEIARYNSLLGQNMRPSWNSTNEQLQMEPLEAIENICNPCYFRPKDDFGASGFKDPLLYYKVTPPEANHNWVSSFDEAEKQFGALDLGEPLYFPDFKKCWNVPESDNDDFGLGNTRLMLNQVQAYENDNWKY